MAIVFNCPHCGELHRVKDDLAGKMGKCKRASCRKQILIPLKSTVSSNGIAGPVDAEALAAAAFLEEAPAAPQEAVAVKKISINCPACDHKFQVANDLQGKNTRCPECGNLFRVAKIIEDKPVDWRAANAGRPSLAKSTEPVPSGAWDVQAKGVSGESIRKAGAHEVEEEEDPNDRRVRRIKTALYGSALVGMIVFAVVFFWKIRDGVKQEKWMDKAIVEIKEGPKRPEHLAAIYRYAGEYHLRSAGKRDDLEASLKLFEEARAQLQPLPNKADRNGMLIELGLTQAACGGELKEINEDRRLPWEKVHPEIRKTLISISPNERDVRQRAMRLLARRLAEKDQGLLAFTIAKNCSNEAELPEFAGRVGIELFLAGKKDLAEKVLAKVPPAKSPALTALYLAIHPEQEQAPAGFVASPAKGTILRNTRLAYAEGKALQGRIKEGRDVAAAPGAVLDRVEAQILVAAVAVESGKNDEAGPILDDLAALLQTESKSDAKMSPAPPWQMLRVVELAALTNKWGLAQSVLGSMKDKPVESWARLELLRIKLATQPKQKADETWLETIDEATPASLPAAIGREEVARHNTAAGVNYDRTVEQMAKGTIRPFGYAGIALGAQDRGIK